MKKRITAVVCALCMCVACMGMFSGCGKTQITDAEYEELAKKAAKTNAGKVVLKITKGDKTHDVTLDMLTYFLAYNESEGNAFYKENIDMFRTMYGENANFWKIPYNETMTMGDTYKDAAYSTALYTLLMYFEAEEVGMTLTESRKNALELSVTRFLSGYTAEERARCGMTEEVIRANYERLFLADQYKEVATSTVQVDTEAVAATIDKEDYRLFETTYLYLSKNTDDAAFNTVAGSTEQRVALMEECLADAKNGTALADIQKKHAQVLTYATRDFLKSNTSSIEPDYVTNAEEMKEGEIRMLNYDYGIYIVKLDSNTKYYGYDDAVTAAIEKEKNTEASKVFTKVEEKYTVVKTDEWDAIEMGTILKAPQK